MIVLYRGFQVAVDPKLAAVQSSEMRDVLVEGKIAKVPLRLLDFVDRWIDGRVAEGESHGCHG